MSTDPTAVASGERGAADQTAADQLIAAVLDVTPQWDGEVIVDTEVTDTTTWWAPGETPEPAIPDSFTTPVFGDPTPIAARQAVKVAEFIHDYLASRGFQDAANAVDDLADAIEAAR